MSEFSKTVVDSERELGELLERVGEFVGRCSDPNVAEAAATAIVTIAVHHVQPIQQRRLLLKLLAELPPHVSDARFPKGFVRLRGREANGGARCYYCGTHYFPRETEQELAARKATADALTAGEGAPPGVEVGFDCESCRNGLPKLRAYWAALRGA